MESGEVKMPTTVREAVEYLLQNSFKDDQADWAMISERDAVADEHHGTGTWIRNNFGLWNGSPLKDYFESQGIDHPDDMSCIILTCLHRQLNGRDWDVDGQIYAKKKYWELMQTTDDWKNYGDK